jgi:3-oxoacyl-[acyl-carrier-protein] synthase II
VARLIAYGRVSPAGLLSWAPGGTLRTSWAELDAGPVGEFGVPKLRAKFFFDQPFTKYGRMDPLCKVAVGAAQLAVRASNDLAGLERDEVAQVGGTMLGCLEVDAQFETTRRAGAPSPALFVYTLPSMFQGEIAIAWHLRGRCTLLSTGELSAMTALATGIRWVEKGRAKHVLVVAADAAGPAASELGPDFTPRSAAAAWLLSGDDAPGRRLSDARFDNQPSESLVLQAGELSYGVTFADTLEPLLLGEGRQRVYAERGGRGVSFQIG